MGLAVALVALALGMRLCRRAPIPPSPPQEVPPPVEIPILPEPAPPLPQPLPPRALATDAARPSPERLLDFLRKLGRARLLRDRRRLAELRVEMPPLYPSDVAWLRSRLMDELFTASGAAEMIRLHRISDAVPELGEVLSHPAHPFLKDLVIDTLAALGSDAAVVVVLAALRADPDETVRARCAAALARFHGPESYHALVAALRDPRPQVRSAAAGALRLKKGQNAAETLLEALRAESEPRVQADFAVSAYAAGGEEWRESILEALRGRPDTVSELRKRSAVSGEGRYARAYEREFFEAGGVPISYDPSGRRVGITVELGESITLEEVTEALFAAAPLGRYRGWFTFRRADEFPAPRAYDSYGKRMEDVAYNELDGTVYIRFKDPASFEEGVLGYARGCEVHVTRLSLLHEFGHAFAQLADEYPEGSTRPAANLSAALPPPWAPLSDAGHLPEEAMQRDGAFTVPSADCHMSNRRFNSRFCPVCQLQIHARMAELTGAPVPWNP